MQKVDAKKCHHTATKRVVQQAPPTWEYSDSIGEGEHRREREVLMRHLKCLDCGAMFGRDDFSTLRVVK